MTERALDCVVTNYRTANDLDRFLASYAAYPCYWAGQLTVVNVSPGPADIGVAEDWQRKLGLRHVVFEDNVGYARASNHGALQGDGDVVAVFNADIVLRCDALTLCYEAIRGEPNWGVLGPRQVNAHNRLVGCGVYGDPRHPRQSAWMETDIGQCSAVRTDALTVSGSAYFMRRAVWSMLTDCSLYRNVAPEAEGPLLPTQHYYEETFCSYHARAHGLKVVFFGPVVITHLWHRASPQGGEPDRQMGAARRLFREACAVHGITCE